MKRFYFLLPLLLLTVALMAMSGFRDSQMPESIAMAGPTPLPTVTPTTMPAPGWWHAAELATPTLKKLPGVPRPQFDGGAGGDEPGKKVPFQITSCPTNGVKITDIRTAESPWWHISGTAAIPDLWYWKAEISADGANWASLYRSEAAVTGGVLVRLNLSTIPASARHVKLTAVDKTWNYPEPCLVEIS